MATKESTLRFDVSSRDMLESMVSDSLPLDLRPGTPVRRLFRDIYLDTMEGDLGRRGVICRFRVGVDDKRSLSVEIREPVGGMLVTWRRSEADVPEVDPLPALKGLSEPARMLRGVIDPARLTTRAELQIERWVRPIKAGLFPLTRFEILYDVATVMVGARPRTFQELVISRIRKGPPSLELLVEKFQERYDLHVILASQLERAEEILAGRESGSRTSVEAERWLSIVGLKGSEVALLRSDESLILPSAPGAGETDARAVGSEFFDHIVSLRHLGTVNRPETAKCMEVWLVNVSESDVGSETSVLWLPLGEVIGKMGSPSLRDPDTLAAVGLVSRTSLIGVSDSADGAPTPSVLETPEIQERRPDDGLDFQPRHYLNADLSNLEFNARVLSLAEDESTPLLARVRFLSIFSANLDEFFMVRVGGLLRSVSKGRAQRSPDGMTPQECLDAIGVKVQHLARRQRELLNNRCLPELESHGIRLLSWAELSAEHRAEMETYFSAQLFPVLTPHAITRAPGHPFPQIGNLRLALAITVSDTSTGRVHFGSIDVPDDLPRFVRLSGTNWFIPIEEVLKNNLHKLYGGRNVDGAYCFRVTRSGDLELDEEAADSLLDAVEEEVKRRPFASTVRLEVEKEMPQAVRDLLQRELRYEDASREQRLGDVDVQEVKGLMGMSALSEIASLPIPELDYPSFDPASPFNADKSIFDLISERDWLVCLPYDSFDDTVQRFIVEAAHDDRVIGIRLTLYRTGGRSKIVDALIAAADAGKSVDVFVELKARFDEQRNISWARRLEQAGIHVVTGLVKLKTHAKTALVVRREENRVRRYVHIGTGNYNSATSKLYTDLGLFSADEELGKDLNDLFNELIGLSGAPQTEFRKLLVAPSRMLSRFVELIERETQHAKEGREARIRVKVNGLEDSELIDKLYRASQSGVKIGLVVRGLCSLRPGVPGISENITVVSVLGRFLEHSRIFHFNNNGDEEYYIGSADWRPRNLRRRVEVITRVEDGAARGTLDKILSEQLSDPTAWELAPDGSYAQRALRGGLKQ